MVLRKYNFAKNNYCYVSIYSESFTVKMKKKNYFGCGQRFLQLMRENIITQYPQEEMVINEKIKQGAIAPSSLHGSPFSFVDILIISPW